MARAMHPLASSGAPLAESTAPTRSQTAAAVRPEHCSRAVKGKHIVLVVRSHRHQQPGQLKIDVEIAGV